MPPDLYEHYEALFEAIDAAATVPVLPVSSYEDQTGEPMDLPFIVYRNETDRGLYGTPSDGSSKVLRSTWLITSYDRDLDDAMTHANEVLAGILDADLTTDDGYETTAITLIGFMPLFEKEGPNYAVHCRVMWERSI